MMDEIADLADRLLAKQRRVEELDFEFAIEWGSLTGDERDELLALIEQRRAHREERLQAIEENVGALKALLVLLVRSAPPGMSLPEAIGSGHIGLMEVVETIRGAVPGPLPERS
jgi:predicted Fe-S protein YdhL (DUF1289 family)